MTHSRLLAGLLTGWLVAQAVHHRGDLKNVIRFMQRRLRRRAARRHMPTSVHVRGEADPEAVRYVSAMLFGAEPEDMLSSAAYRQYVALRLIDQAVQRAALKQRLRRIISRTPRQAK